MESKGEDSKYAQVKKNVISQVTQAFEKNIDESDMLENEEEFGEDEEAYPDSDEDCHEDKNEMAFSQSLRDESNMDSVFRMSGSSAHDKKNNSSSDINNRTKKPKQTSSNSRSGRPPISKRSNPNIDENDGLDIQSLSVVEAEFIYNKIDEGKSSSDSVSMKRTINLDTFKIIKVIGKGNFLIIFLNII